MMLKSDDDNSSVMESGCGNQKGMTGEKRYIQSLVYLVATSFPLLLPPKEAHVFDDVISLVKAVSATKVMVIDKSYVHQAADKGATNQVFF